MRRLLPNIFVVAAAIVLAAGCTDYNAQISELEQQIGNLTTYCNTLNTNAQGLEKLVEAAQTAQAAQSFEPIVKNGGVVGFKAVFTGTGEVKVYNQSADISVGEFNGKYYWMAGGDWLRDSSGKMVEIAPGAVVPLFRAALGELQVSLDGGATWQHLGYVDKQLISSVKEYEDRVVFTFSSGAEATIFKALPPLTLALEGGGATIVEGESVTLAYTVTGASDATVKVVCGSGWSAVVTPDETGGDAAASGAQAACSGTITISAPDAIGQSDVQIVVTASDGAGRMVACEVHLAAQEKMVLSPLKDAVSVPADGGEVTVGVKTNVDYSIETDAEWLRYVETRAVRTEVLVFEAEANGFDPRTAAVTLTSGNYSTQVVFSQGAAERVFVVSPSYLSFPYSGGSKTFTVQTNVNYSYKVSDEWLSIQKSEGEDVDTYTVTAEPNASIVPRAITVIFSGEGVSGRTLSVSQSGVPRFLNVSPMSLNFEWDGGSGDISVSSNMEYTVEVSGDWFTLTDNGDGTYHLSATENPSETTRAGTVTFRAEDGSYKAASVRQAGKPAPKIVIPTASGGANLYVVPSSDENNHYRYGPSIIRNSDGSLDVWTSKEGTSFNSSTAAYCCQENGTRFKVDASHTIAQYFNVQHTFMRVMVNVYGTNKSGDKFTLKLYRWAGSVAATLATTPLNSTDFSGAVATSGNMYSIYNAGNKMLPQGEYMWALSDASAGIGVYATQGAGTIYLTDAVSYMDGEAQGSWNYRARLRNSAYNSSWFADSFPYFHSTDGGATWSAERDVFYPTENKEDSWSVCDPGVAYFGGWYYLAYTSAPYRTGSYEGTNLNGRFNHCYVARSRTPVGPWYKWNGSGWGGDPAKIVEFKGDTREWGIGEPSIVVKDNTIYFYHSLVEGYSKKDAQGKETIPVKPVTRKTMVLTAPVSDDWPAHLTDRGVALDHNSVPGVISTDSADVKYVEDYDLFYAFHCYYIYTSYSKVAVWTSTDGLRFTYRGYMTGSFQLGCANMGVSGDGQGHIRLSEQQYIGYAYGVNTWGRWNTWFCPIFFYE